LPKAVDLRRIAEWTGAPVEAIQDLNPELRRWTTPVRASNYALKVPEGTADLVRARLENADSEELAPLKWHTVKSGETLTSIARKLRVSRTDLAEANYLPRKTTVKAGQQLIIPRAPTTLLAARAETPAPVAESRSVENAVASAAPRLEPSAQAKLIYRVKRGDTLLSIAKVFRTSVASIKSWNQIRGSSIRIGDRLTIFTNRTVANE